MPERIIEIASNSRRNREIISREQIIHSRTNYNDQPYFSVMYWLFIMTQLNDAERERARKERKLQKVLITHAHVEMNAKEKDDSDLL